MNNMDIKEVVNSIVKGIKYKCLVHIYHSKYSSYIRLNGGLANSIRVSNHKSNKEHLRYKFNLRTDVNQMVDRRVSTNNNHRMYFFGIEELQLMINMVNTNIKDSMSTMPYENYRNEIERRINTPTLLNSKLETVRNF